MISKKVGISPKNDNYARLADYIADAGHKGEKSLMHWCVGCLGGDDYQDGIAEAVDVQAMNTRSKQSKTYHLVISFRPEDEAKLTPEVFRAIEERFSAALGYSEHQRHCGVHKNTANLHMHIAYNMIHPEKHTRHEPFRDYRTRDKVCRELEQEYGLFVDHGIDKSVPDRVVRSNEKAQLVEAHTGQQSFDSYAKEHRGAILRALDAATSWQDLHTALAVHGMEIKKHGRGLAVKDRHNNRSAHAIRASALDRKLSMQNLEARFGSYQPPHGLEHIQERTRYTAAPLHRSPERGQLFAEYKVGIEARKEILQSVKDREEASLAAIRVKWAEKRLELERKNIAKKNLRRLLQLARKHEAEALVKAKISFQEPRNAVRRDIPFTSWNGFLLHKAEQGNETALAVLRSRTQTVASEQKASPTKDWSQHGLEQSARAELAAKERAILEQDGISAKGKNRLQSVLRMEQVAKGFRHHVDRKGTVVFTLQDGDKIRDNGKDILFSANNESARQTALLYARKKWGKRITLEANKIVRQEEPERKRAQGMER